jgi:hypothetical protein
MKQESYELFKNASLQEIISAIDAELKNRHEEDFWGEKVTPFTEAILSVLIPLRDAGRLFDPEGKSVNELTPELFLRWSDFVSLKSLAFKMQKSNLDIDLETLGAYLSRYNVNLDKESLDFPISSYNLHQGVSNVIKSLL